MTHASNIPARHDAGLTLIELLLVLLILALLAGVALRSTDAIIAQSRYDATNRTLSNIEQAVIGPEHQRDASGVPMITGFVADMGRMPRAEGDNPGTQLSELWENATSMPVFRIAAPAGDAQVRVGAGWRGPYLRLGAGRHRLTDGWGNAFELTRADDATPVSAGQPVPIVRSLGSDHLIGGIDYQEDAELVFERAVAGPDQVPPRNQATLSGHVYLDTTGNNPAADPNALVVVRLYGPVDGNVGTIAQFTAAPTGGLISFDFDEDANSISDPLPIGPRVLRAYLIDAVTGVPGKEDRLDNDPMLSAVSPPRGIVIGVDSGIVNLTLQTAAP